MNSNLLRISKFGFRIVVFATAICLTPIAGCGPSGPPRVAIEGIVSQKGRPVPTGSISYLPSGENVGPAATTAILEGQYKFTKKTGPVVGTHRVLINIDPRTPKLPGQEAPAQNEWEFDVTVSDDEQFDGNFDLR